MENEVKVDIGPPPGEMVVESEIESFEDLGPGTGIDNFITDKSISTVTRFTSTVIVSFSLNSRIRDAISIFVAIINLKIA